MKGKEFNATTYTRGTIYPGKRGWRSEMACSLSPWGNQSLSLYIVYPPRKTGTHRDSIILSRHTQVTDTTLATTRAKLAAPSARASAQEPRAEALIAWSATELAVSALAWDPPRRSSGRQQPEHRVRGGLSIRTARWSALAQEVGRKPRSL